jgi:hypothetical protein
MRPPPLEIRIFSPVVGNGATYTSRRPEAFDSKEKNRPSGEKRTFSSSNGVWTIGELVNW